MREKEVRNNIMKCTQCESTSFAKIELNDIMNVQGDAYFRGCETLECFSCCECGHIIFFDKFLINKKNALKSINEKFDSQISALYFRRNEILKGHSNGTDSEFVQIQKEIKKLEEQKKHEIQEVEKQFAYRKFNFL